MTNQADLTVLGMMPTALLEEGHTFTRAQERGVTFTFLGWAGEATRAAGMMWREARVRTNEGKETTRLLNFTYSVSVA